MLIARLSLIFLPFSLLARFFGQAVPPADARAAETARRLSASHKRLAEDIGWAVTRSARHLPLTVVCLPQAMAARAMLQRRGIASVLHLGASTRPLEGHAWLDAGGVEVTGYPVPGRVAEVTCFL